MGNKAQGPFREAYNPTLQGWQLSRRTGQFNVWKNVTSGQEMEQYRFVINDIKEFQHQKEIFEFRYDSSTLVSSRYFREDTQRELCSTYYKGMLFLERIPIRLSNINDVPYPDVLHLYHQAFRGFAELHDRMGYFIIDENMICLNQQGRVKVWANNQLEKSFPADSIMGAQGTQKEMVRRIIQLIDQNTDNSTLPQNIGAMLQQADPNTFRDADLMVQNFAARHRTIIPSQVDAVLRREDVVRTANSIYLHSPSTLGNTPANNIAVGLVQTTPAITKMSLIGNHNIATFGHQTAGSNLQNTNIVPQIISHTFAPQPVMQTFAQANGPIPSTPVADILPTLMTTIQPPPSTIAINTNRQQRNTGVRSTSVMVRPRTGSAMMTPFVVGLTKKHPNAANIVTQHAAGKQTLHIEKLISNKPTTGPVVQAYELNSQRLLMKGPYNHRFNSKSLAPETHHTNLQGSGVPAVQASIINNVVNRNYSSMINIGLKNNLAGINNKKIQQVTLTQQTNQQSTQAKPLPEKRMKSVRSQIIAPVQPIINRTIDTQQHQAIRNQTHVPSPPTSYVMQHISKMNQARHQSLSQSAQTVSQLRSSSNSAFFRHKQMSTVNQHAQNKQSNPSVTNPNIQKQVITKPYEEKRRVYSNYNSTIVKQVPVKGSHIFHSSQLHPGVHITYESSRIATNTSDLYMPENEPQMSFGKGESNIYVQIQNSDQSHLNTPISQPNNEGILSSKQILDTITYFKNKKDDHLTSHLPVTYSVLKESEEFLSKYGGGFTRTNEYPTYGQTATSGIRASLGSHYNEEDVNLGRNLYYNKQQFQQQSRQLEEPFRPIYSESQPTQGYYTGIQVEYHKEKVETTENIIQSVSTTEIKYSTYEESLSTKREDLRNIKNTLETLQPQSHITTMSFADSQPIQPAVDEYTMKMDNDLRKDLEQMRKSYL